MNNFKSMTRIILLFATLTLSATTFGQKKDDDKKGKPGLMFGANFSNINTSGADTKTGFYGGVLWEQKIIPAIRFQSGLLYLQNGVLDKTGNIETKVTLDYVQLPIIAKVKILAFYGLGGFTGGYRVAATTVVDGNTTKINKDDLNRVDIGAQVGLGFKILFFGIEGRYNWGLSNIYKAEDTNTKNRSFQLGIHFML